MDFLEVVKQTRAALQSEGRITYRTLKRQFALDDEALDDLKYELIEGQEVAADKDGKMLVWTGGETPEETASETVATPAVEPSASALSAQPDHEAPAGERRQLTVMFCDLVESTPLAERLDPEEYREIVQTYQAACAKVIQSFDGHVAQYLGDGILVYFGFPLAHEDDAQRSVRAAMGILEEITALNEHLQREKDLQIAVRLGIHTGLVVVGYIGAGEEEIVPLRE